MTDSTSNERVCPNCGNPALAFCFSPDERGVITEWTAEGQPAEVAVTVDEETDELEYRRLTPGDIEASQQAMEEKSYGNVLNCGGCGHWFNPEEAVPAS